MPVTAAELSAQGPEAAVALEVATSFEAVAGLQREWDELVLAVESNAFMSYEWSRLWWEHFGRERKLQLFVFRERGRLVGLLPLLIDEVWIGPLRLRVAKLVGSDFCFRVLRPPVRPERAAVVYERALRRLLTDQRCDVVRFGPVSGQDEQLPHFLQAGRQAAGAVGVVHDVVIDCHTTFHLQPSFEQYLGGLDAKQRNKCRRDSRLLQEHFKVEVEVVRDPARLEQAYIDFRDLHDRLWNSRGRLGHFESWQEAGTFYREVVREFGKLGRVRFIRIKADGQLVACQFALVYGPTCHAMLPGRASGPEWERFHLGRVGLANLIQAAIGEGLKRIESGQGHYPYKVEFGGTEYPMHAVLVASDRRWARLKIRLFRAFATGLDLLYYKVLVRRLSPRFPFLRHPLWPYWVRMRLY